MEPTPATVQHYHSGRIRLRALNTWHPYFAQFTAGDWDVVISLLDRHPEVAIEHPESAAIFPLTHEKDGTWRCLRGPLVGDIPFPFDLAQMEGSWLNTARYVGYALWLFAVFAVAGMGAWGIAGELGIGLVLNVGLMAIVDWRMGCTQIPQPCTVLPQAPPIGGATRTRRERSPGPRPAVHRDVIRGGPGEQETSPTNEGQRRRVEDMQTPSTSNQRDSIACQQEDHLTGNSPMAPSRLHSTPLPLLASVKDLFSRDSPGPRVAGDDWSDDAGEGDADGNDPRRPNREYDVTHLVNDLNDLSANPPPQNAGQDVVDRTPRDHGISLLHHSDFAEPSCRQPQEQTDPYDHEHCKPHAAAKYEWVGWSLAMGGAPLASWWTAQRSYAMLAHASARWTPFAHRVLSFLSRHHLELSLSSSMPIPSFPSWHGDALLAIGIVGVTSVIWYGNAIAIWSAWRALPVIRLSSSALPRTGSAVPSTQDVGE